MSHLPMPPGRKIVKGYGREEAKIAIVGDYTSRFDIIEDKPFSGFVGDILNECLRSANILRSDVYLTNVFKSDTKIPGKDSNKDFFDEGKKKFTTLGYEHAEMLQEELNNIGANIIVAAGAPALLALTALDRISAYRGYITHATKLDFPRKILPTFSFSVTVRAYLNRYIIINDLRKAREQSAFPEIRRPEREVIYDYSSLEEITRWLEYIYAGPQVSFDIEVINYAIASVQFSITPELAVVVPLGPSDLKPNGWSLEEEAYLWRWIQKILGTEKPKVAQNGIFDIHFLATECGIVVRGPLHDTMISHHIMHPDMQKGLEFLGSIYCGSQMHWKRDVKFDNIKEES
jgi:uracil-DNA glycosylase family 4